MQVTNCVAPPTKQPEEGGAPQSPLEESATTSARWVRNDQLPLHLSLQVPVFERLFFSKQEVYVHRHAPKKAPKKRPRRQTHRQTDKIGPIWSSSGVVFWAVKSQIPFADAPKRGPENNTPNSLKNPVKGHLRLASVVALSSSGACGAILTLFRVFICAIYLDFSVNVLEQKFPRKKIRGNFHTMM